MTFISRLAMALPIAPAKIFGGLIVIGMAGIYLVALLRANYRTWVSSMIAGLALDQLLRSRDLFGLFAHATANIPVGAVRLVPPLFVILFFVIGPLVFVSVVARSSARLEPYRPGSLGTLGGFALGGFLSLEFLVLGMPNVVAHWSEVPYSGAVPLMMAATVLPLIPGVRAAGSELLQVFDERLRGWIWLLASLLMIVVGNRFVGLMALLALGLAQFMAIMLLWWIPRNPILMQANQSAHRSVLVLLHCSHWYICIVSRLELRQLPPSCEVRL